MKLFSRFFKKDKRIVTQAGKSEQNAVDNSAVAAAFAEAGEPDTARQMLKESRKPCYIMVIGNEDRFSSQLMEYAIDMAKRINCGLLALNTSDAHMSLPRPYRDEACKVFKESAVKHMEQFKKLAELNGIEFKHIVLFGDQDEVIEKIHKDEKGTISYILTEPSPELMDTSNGQVAIPVFGLAQSITA